MTTIRDYKAEINKAVDKNGQVVLRFIASKELRELLFRATINTTTEVFLGDGRTINRLKIKRPIMRNLSLNGLSSLLFEESLARNGWNGNISFRNAQEAVSFIKDIPDIIGVLASFFEKFDNGVVKNGM